MTTIALFDAGSTLLARIDDTDYVAVREVHAITGDTRERYCLESDWASSPMARIAALLREVAELRQALSEERPFNAETQRVKDAERRREDAHEENLSASLNCLPLSALKPPRNAEDGRIPCGVPGCLEWFKPRGMGTHKRKAHGIAGEIGHKQSKADKPTGERRKCPYCRTRPLLSAMDAHIARAHPRAQPREAAAPIALALGQQRRSVETSLSDAPWLCAACHSNAHTRSLSSPTLCIRCAVGAVAHTNGVAS